jgi:hypothetical protein
VPAVRRTARLRVAGIHSKALLARLLNQLVLLAKRGRIWLSVSPYGSSRDGGEGDGRVVFRGGRFHQLSTASGKGANVSRTREQNFLIRGRDRHSLPVDPSLAPVRPRRHSKAIIGQARGPSNMDHLAQVWLPQIASNGPEPWAACHGVRKRAQNESQCDRTGVPEFATFDSRRRKASSSASRGGASAPAVMPPQNVWTCQEAESIPKSARSSRMLP